MFVDRGVPKDPDELHDVVVAQVRMAPLDASRDRPDRGHGHAVVFEVALQVRLLVGRPLRCAARAQFVVDLRGERTSIYPNTIPEPQAAIRSRRAVRTPRTCLSTLDRRRLEPAPGIPQRPVQDGGLAAGGRRCLPAPRRSAVPSPAISEGPSGGREQRPTWGRSPMATGSRSRRRCRALGAPVRARLPN